MYEQQDKMTSSQDDAMAESDTELNRTRHSDAGRDDEEGGGGIGVRVPASRRRLHE